MGNLLIFDYLLIRRRAQQVVNARLVVVEPAVLYFRVSCQELLAFPEAVRLLDVVCPLLSEPTLHFCQIKVSRKSATFC